MQCIQGNPVILYTKELHWYNLLLVNGRVFVNARKILVLAVGKICIGPPNSNL
jgi:hypothetical protein